MTYRLASPNEVSVWPIDFSDVIADGVSISSATASIDEGELVSTSHDTSVVTVTVAAIGFGRVARVTCRATLTSGEVFEKEIAVRSGGV